MVSRLYNLQSGFKLKSFFKISGFLIAILYSSAILAQETHSDSSQNKLLDAVEIKTKRNVRDYNEKPLSGLDAFLEKHQSINMVRRGAYAWEPFLNGMNSERSVVTIDGMRIYSACTDKMDPATSYLEITNLSKANIHSGQSGSFGGSSIAGSIDLVRRKGDFGTKSLTGNAFTGFESNNLHKVIGASLSYSKPKIFSDFDFTFRDANNYKAGGNQEVLYSQFTKYNVSGIVGYKISEHQEIEVSAIYDLATDIGYPALPMDVSTASAFIGYIDYTRHHISDKISFWKTKLYFNDVTHVMDDTKRPIVPIRMDMPGWSKTYGFYSLILGKFRNHYWKTTLNGHQNNSLAEMTMYPNNPLNPSMFMLTWPDVNTNYIDINAEDYVIFPKFKILFNLGLALHNNFIKSELGFNSLSIFYPDLLKSKNRFLKRGASTLIYDMNLWNFELGLEYGERAPSISEGYGFYLFNSFDKYDYIGNPNMKNESSISTNGKISFRNKHFRANLNSSVFYIRNYIIGMPEMNFTPMSIIAEGVRVYEQLNNAKLFNTSLLFSYFINERWMLSVGTSYRRGTSKEIGNLPLIQPLSYNSEIKYIAKTFDIEATVLGATKNTAYNSEFGETPVNSYFLFNLAASKNFKWKKYQLTSKMGVENIFDTNYTTFSDWNRIPRPGRNFYLNLVWSW